VTKRIFHLNQQEFPVDIELDYSSFTVGSLVLNSQLLTHLSDLSLDA
jgi:hypothetical protein